jgi:2-keto-4-pentenoate hydratase/2-oxohepta-3-ene-1,7-dioic acid hydratase in catechol pathway
MRIARIETSGTVRVALVDDDRLRLLPADTDVRDVLRDPTSALPTAETLPVDIAKGGGVRLLPPVEPPSIRDFLTFEQHVEGMVRLHEPPRDVHPRWYDAPSFYFSNPHSLIGAHDDVQMPPGCEVFDFELEVAAVIGRDGRDLTPESAREHIAGYAIFNDWSARDLQFEEMQVGLGPAKGKDSAITFGPWLVTADEVDQYRSGDRLDLDLEVLVNGERTGRDNLLNMAWSFEDLVAYASRGAWVRTGDVLGSGTCGSGCLAELWGRAGERLPPPLAVGDVVTMNVECLGTVSNRVVAGAEPLPVPRARSTRVEAR